MFGAAVLLLIPAFLTSVRAQTQIAQNRAAVEELPGSDVENVSRVTAVKRLVKSVLPNYYSQVDGISLDEIINRAFANNGDIKIALLEVEKAKARLQQALLRQNPVLEVEQSTGKLVGASGEGDFSVSFAIPIDAYDRKGKRADLANAEITLKEAEVSARKRELSAQILAVYTEALSALHEIKVLEDLLELDIQTARFVQIRVNEGETSPLELNLLQTEIERLRSRQILVEGRLQASISRLKFYAGLSYEQPLKLKEDLAVAVLPNNPPTIETAFAIALKSRPEIRLAELEQELATAGLRLITANGKPDFTAYSRYKQGRSVFDDPRGDFSQRDRTWTFGVTIGLPVFNKNQGAKAEAEIAVRMAQEKRNFAEQVIKNEVATAFARIEATNNAYTRLETAVLPRSRKNVETIRSVYEIGELKITDLINEQRRLLDVNRDLTEVLTERYRANADLFIALGTNF